MGTRHLLRRRTETTAATEPRAAGAVTALEPAAPPSALPPGALQPVVVQSCSRRGWLLLALTAVGGCGVGAGRAAVSLRVSRTQETPRDASVFIDEEYVGPLGFVARRGVRLPVGEHRITVQKEGYFPWDQLVVADREPIFLRVQLEPIPD